MTRTKPLVLVLTALAAATIAFLGERALQGAGMQIFVPPVTLGVAVVVIAAIVLAMAWPVRQAVKGKRQIDFRHATAVVGLAKASAIVAAVFGGVTLGILGYLLTRPVVAEAFVLIDVVSLIGCVVLLVAAVLAESWCVLPPSDDEQDARVTNPA